VSELAEALSVSRLTEGSSETMVEGRRSCVEARGMILNGEVGEVEFRNQRNRVELKYIVRLKWRASFA
jgi:hypothetical protein